MRTSLRAVSLVVTVGTLVPAPSFAQTGDRKEERKPWVRFDHKQGFDVFGVSTTGNAAGDSANKRLTFAGDGSTNHTAVRIDNQLLSFALAPGKLTKSERTEQPVPSSEVVWTWNNVDVTENLTIVEGPPVDTPEGSKRFLNMVLVRYRFTNKDRRSHRVALRMQIDTLIGGNDGVPFTIPGKSGLVTTFADFRTPKDVPLFVQALERPNLKDPGTVMQANLKIGGGVEAPDRVSLTHWPGAIKNWEIPIAPLAGDSALVLYWFDKDVAAGKAREIGFEYGLGSVTSSGGRLGITLGGNFDVGGYFTVTALVTQPTPNQKLTLTLPAGLERLDGAATQPVPPSKMTSVVTWKVQINKAGEYELKVTSNDGLSQTKSLTIGQSPANKKMSFDLRDATRRTGLQGPPGPSVRGM
jgi:hypothetical protein